MQKAARPRRGSRKARLPIAVTLAVILGGAAGYLAFPETQPGALSAGFTMCARPPHSDCVIDGDTFYLGSQAIRIADIDTPETHPPRCEYEAELGERATRAVEGVGGGSPSLQPALAGFRTVPLLISQPSRTQMRSR